MVSLTVAGVIDVSKLHVMDRFIARFRVCAVVFFALRNPNLVLLRAFRPHREGGPFFDAEAQRELRGAEAPNCIGCIVSFDNPCQKSLRA